MATKSSFWLRGKKGRLAGTTVYQSKGRTIQREIVDVANPQTRAQMEQRVKWPNLVNFYKVMRPVLKYGFENKKQTQSDYNALMSINASRETVPYITKSQARQGFVAHAPYQVTQGTLGSYTNGISEDAAAACSAIVLSENFAFTGNTTIGELTTEILANNASLREGMQISFIMLQGGDDAQVANVSLYKAEFILSAASTEKIDQYWPDITTAEKVGDGNIYLGMPIDGSAAKSFAFVVSETISGKTKVSTEQMFLNVPAMEQLDSTTDSTALNDAILSYGVSEIAFLNSTEAKKQ